MYILGTPRVGSKEWTNPTHWGDIVRYIKAFSNKSKDNEQQIYDSALHGAYWTFADPSLLISLFNYFRDFIILGKSRVRNPMIEIENFAFLPFADFHLSPFGYEYYAGTYLKYNKTLYEAYYRWSDGNIDGKSYGIEINILNIIRFPSLKCDVGFDLWKQGFNLLYYERDNDRYRETTLSGKVHIEATYHVNSTLSLFGQTSYKGDGYLLGNPVSHGFSAKIGTGFCF